MARFFPKSLLGQSLLAIAVTLLIGQAVSGLLLYRAAQDRRDAATVNAAAFHLLRMVNRETDSPRDIRRALRRAEPEGRIDIGRGRGERRRGLPPRLSGMIADASPLLPGERRAAGEEAQLREILARQGVAAEALVVTIRPVAQDTLLASLADEFPRFRARWRDGLSEREVMVAALRMPGESRWIVARALRPPVEAGVLWLIAAQTVLLFLVLLAATYLVLRRITRPLARLTERVESFARTHEAREPLPERGPEDVSRLIAAHNLLEHRIAALLDEKDVMLGAIGHDLKTPLAALRVRIESVADETQRARMAETIEDLRRSLDDILSLARIGRAKDPPEATQLAALVESVVEEFEDVDRPVAIAHTDRIVAPVQVTWLRRALRNLIENALRYGGTAQVSLTREGGTAVIAVEDEGPGIPPEDVAAMLEPFRRGEASRNRGTGGAGLGLTLTRAILAEHGGELRLANRTQGGLRAEMRLPLSA
ncbi:histidine kinase [Citromicrobium sp. RCC1885]|uniref:sensor histidine kinase n=1 Tax=unclassified Citromicrobium TaxID=2630544 RepID=UPI0006C8F7BD|nr:MULTISPECIES: ATP-binding protein [unclassified Citromicrobium]KPM24507.1 histidine kinase [Citromicrobium sp. RCC1885]KPM27749.1 histidine kinase [Citromicrobium sp. RCC1878]OAM10755.1 two-component sensor histidine kinase [Citromicrobium sp. RCC1897]